jgi:hypothetical protein
MKTSNIILTTLIGSITFVIISAFMQVRFAGEKKDAYTENVYLDEHLRDFKYLIIKDAINLQVMSAQQSKITVTQGKGENDPRIKYHQKGDTLFIDEIGFGQHSRSLLVRLQTPSENLHLIQASNSGFSISDFNSNNLQVKLDHSRLDIGDHENSKIMSLDITGINNSSIDAHQGKLDTVLLYLDHSEARLSVSIRKLKAVMANHSSISRDNVGDLEVKKDDSSRFH